MDGDIHNPINIILESFKEIDYTEALKTELGEPISKYDFTETMLVLANSQMALMNLVASMNRNDDDGIKKHADFFSTQMATIMNAALAAGGKDFSKKVLGQLRAGDE